MQSSDCSTYPSHSSRQLLYAHTDKQCLPRISKRLGRQTLPIESFDVGVLLRFILCAWIFGLGVTALAESALGDPAQGDTKEDTAKTNRGIAGDFEVLSADNSDNDYQVQPLSEKELSALKLSAEELLSEDASIRQQATAKFIQVGIRALPCLPIVRENLSKGVVDGLLELRANLENGAFKKLQTRSLITLGEPSDFKASLNALSKQSGIKIHPPRVPVPLTKEDWGFHDTPFWQAIDTVLDKFAMTVDQANDGELIVIPQDHGSGQRGNLASYIDAFRIQPLHISKSQNLAFPSDSSMSVDLEFSWEPSRTPSLIAIPRQGFEVVCDSGEILSPADGEPLIFFPVGGFNTQISLMFPLPSRLAKKIDKWTGSFQVAYSGALAGVEFGDLKMEGFVKRSLQNGILHVTLEGIAPNRDLIEIRVGTRVDADQIREGWEQIWLDNQQAYIVDAQGERVDHVGWTTSRFDANDTGMTFLFELEKGLEGCKFVYLAPGAIHTTTHNFEIADIPLP